MRSPTASPLYRILAQRGSEAVGAVEPKPGATPREHARASRSFAELLAAAEAVQDHVELHRAPAGRLAALQSGVQGAVQGAVHGAAGFLARQAPWMGLPLLLHRPARGPRPPEEE